MRFVLLAIDREMALQYLKLNRQHTAEAHCAYLTRSSEKLLIFILLHHYRTLGICSYWSDDILCQHWSMRQHQFANGSLRAGSCTSYMPHRQIATSGMPLLLSISKVQKALGREGEVLM